MYTDYAPRTNEIVFPPGIMQFPIFSMALPSYVSYGAFGSIVGHEVSHAFDNIGRLYDEKGRDREWWTNSTVMHFKQRAECFVGQYDNFTMDVNGVEPVHINGRLTLGENIADAGGLGASFQAWKTRYASLDRKLPGLDFFSLEQRFFVSFGNLWCGRMRNGSARERILTDPHSPSRARILGTLANSREFREAFRCKEKAPTCDMW
jgi:endothelin-converting enzyme